MPNNLRQTFASYIEDVESPVGQLFNLLIMGLILFSSAIFVLETYALPLQLRLILDAIDRIILLIFVIEYFLRFWIAQSKVNFFFSPVSLIDLIAIVPFFLGLTDIRFILIFRWFRILRLIRFFNLKIYIFKLSNQDSIILTRILFTLFTIIFVYSGLIYQVEHKINPKTFGTFLDAFYFAVVTMTTVGFGDLTPTSEGGRLLTVLMILTGIALIPWQLSDLVKHLLKTANQVEQICTGCGLLFHDSDAHFCKICGTQLDSFSQHESIRRT